MDEVDIFLKAYEKYEKEIFSVDTESSVNLDAQIEVKNIIPEPGSHNIKLLQEQFGHNKFRALQWKVIHYSMIEKRDQCVIMSTGSGKSLCYQYPAIYKNGLSVVISPLISLMEDQMANISATFLGSSQESSHTVIQELYERKYKLLYITPEYSYMHKELLQNLDKKIGITMISIDEAHCISHWGQDFREAYRKLGMLKQVLPEVPFLAMTATATRLVEQDICSSLSLKNPIITRSGCSRPNLFLAVRLKGPSIILDLQTIMTKKSLYQWHFDGPTIIYCPTKKAVEDLYSILIAQGVNSAMYHSGISLEARRKAHKQFITDQITVVVATVAFGMGIDKPDVRHVIHYGAPRDIESYYQEIGRAGRDGLPAYCCVFYSSSDFCVHNYFLSEIQNDTLYKHRQKMIHSMRQYLTTASCRWNIILKYFDDMSDQNPCLSESCCDNCKLSSPYAKTKKMEEERIELGEPATVILNAVSECEGYLGLNSILLLLRGSKSQKISQYQRKKFFGSGKQYSASFLKELATILLQEGYIEQQKRQGSQCFWPTIKITKCGNDFLCKTDKTLKLTPSACLKQYLNLSGSSDKLSCIPSVTNSCEIPTDSKNIVNYTPNSIHVDTKIENLHKKLYERLLYVRSKLAADYDCAPYMICTNKMLAEIAKQAPTTHEELYKVNGMTSAKVKHFGDEICQVVDNFCESHDYSKNTCLTSFEAILENKTHPEFTSFNNYSQSLPELSNPFIIKKNSKQNQNQENSFKRTLPDWMQAPQANKKIVKKVKAAKILSI